MLYILVPASLFLYRMECLSRQTEKLWVPSDDVCDHIKQKIESILVDIYQQIHEQVHFKYVTNSHTYPLVEFQGVLKIRTRTKTGATT